MAEYVHLGGAFWKSKTAVVCARQLLSLEPDKVRVFFGHWATDGTRVYHNNRHHRSVDAATFVGLNGIYGKDARQCYCVAIDQKWGGLKTISNADPASFEVLDSGEENISYLWGTNLLAGYARDKTYVFFDGIEIKKADPNTFVSLMNCYARDEQSVFFRHFRLTGVRPVRWRYIGGKYSRDDRHVYYEHRVVKEGNPALFRHIEPFDDEIAYDGAQFYSQGKPFPAGEYATLLRQRVENTKEAADNVESGRWQRNTHLGNWPYRAPDDTLIAFEGVRGDEKIEDIERILGSGQTMSKEDVELYFGHFGTNFDLGEGYALKWRHLDEVMACIVESGRISGVGRSLIDGTPRPVFAPY